MSFVPIVLAIVLLVLAAAFGLHCLVLHCDARKPHEIRHERESPRLRA